MKIFARYVLEIAIIIPDAFFIFLPVRDSLRWRSWIIYSVLGFVLPTFIVTAAWISSENMLPVIPVLVVSVLFLFLLFFFSVKITLGRKLFCFFNSVMMGAFCLLYSIALMASFEAKNEFWDSTSLLSIESGIVSLSISILLCCIFLKVLTEELPMLLKEECVDGIWDFLFLIPFLATLLIAWLKPIWPKILLIGRTRIITLVLLPFIPSTVLLIYYLLWWIAAKFSESAKLQQENTLLTMESKRYEELKNYMDETRALRHDFRHHILVITQLTNSGKFEDLQNYLTQFKEKTERNYTGFCQNIAVDAVASHYAAVAENQKIKIEWRLNLPQDLPLKESEYCVILGNLLENALRAVKNLSQERRYIKVISSLLSETIIGISVDNPFNGKIKFGKNNLPRSERTGHGIGLISVLNTAKRYEGSMNIKTDKNIFSVDIILHCNN